MYPASRNFKALTTTGGRLFSCLVPGESARALRPLMSWWTVLYALSMLARYAPSRWTETLTLADSQIASRIEFLLDSAIDAVPELLWGSAPDTRVAGTSLCCPACLTRETASSTRRTSTGPSRSRSAALYRCSPTCRSSSPRATTSLTTTTDGEPYGSTSTRHGSSTSPLTSDANASSTGGSRTATPSLTR
ncbi:YaaC family protein [Georgenia sp. SUBG003]|uniref:YaaC family protein n=1 Tax=Georgenia sp. SUBG003 TaxID=1497974 RepID=UPI003AB7B69C